MSTSPILLKAVCNPLVRHFLPPHPRASLRQLIRSKHRMADISLPAFNRETRAKYTESPNPGFSYGQKVDATEEGKKWLEGEKAGWTVVDPSKEESRLVDLSLSRTSLAYVC